MTQINDQATQNGQQKVPLTNRETSEARRMRHQMDLIAHDQTRGQTFRMVGFIALFLTVALYLIYIIMSGTKPGPKLYVVRTEQINETVDADAYILRDETYLTAPETGIFHPVVAEGTRSKADSVIGYMVSEDEAALVQQSEDLADLIAARRIELIQGGENPGLLAQHFSMDSALLPMINQLRDATRTQDPAALRESTAHLDEEIRRRNNQDLTQTYGDETLAGLVQEYQAIQAELAQGAEPLWHGTAGLLTFAVHNNEDLWTLTDYPSEALPTPTPPERYTPGSYPNLVRAPEGATLETEALKTRLLERDEVVWSNEPVDADTPVARLITGAWQELHYLLPERGEWAVGDTYDVYIPSDQLMIEDAEVTGVYPVEAAYHLVLRTDRQIEALAARRVVTTEIIQEAPQGLAIPIESLITEPRASALSDDRLQGPEPLPIDGIDGAPTPISGRTSVYRLESGYVQQIPVEVIQKTQSFAIIKSPEGVLNPIRDGNVIILNPESSEGGSRFGR